MEVLCSICRNTPTIDLTIAAVNAPSAFVYLGIRFPLKMLQRWVVFTELQRCSEKSLPYQDGSN